MYLRMPRMIFFHLTSVLSTLTFSLASWGLAVGESQKRQAAQLIPGSTLHIGDALGSGGGVTAAAGVASLLCLGGLFLLHFKTNLPETRKTVMLKELAFGFACILWIATLIPATLIAAKRSGVVTNPNIPAASLAALIQLSGKDLSYRSQTPIKAYLSTGWLAFLSTLINLILVSLEARHVLALSRNGGPTTDGTQGDLAGHHAHVDPRTSTSLNSSTSIGAEKGGVVHNEKLSSEGPGVIGERDVEKGTVQNAELPVALNTEAETGRIA